MNGPNVLTQSRPDAGETRAKADQLPGGNGSARKQAAGIADRLLKFTLSITQILAESPDTEAALERALRMAGETLGWDVGAVWLPDSEGKALRCAQMWCSPNTECSQFRAASFGREFTPGVGLPGRVWSSVKPAWIRDVTRDNNFSRGPMATAEGLHSAFAFPILCGEKFLAVMEFFSAEIRKPDEQLLAVFQILGGQLGQMMERKSAEEKLRQRTRQLAAFLDTAAVGLHRVGPDGIVLWANDAEVQSLGYTQEEYVGRHIAEFHADQEVIADILERLTRGEKLCEHEARLKCKDGSLKTVLIDSSVLWEDGRFVHTQCFTRDITERKQAEARLRENERRFREMIDALPAAIYTTDAQGRVTHFNSACVEFSGRTPQLGSDHWCVTWKLFHPDGRAMPHDQCPMAVALKEGRVVRGAEAIAERPDGTRIWFTPYPTPLRDAEGRVVGGINMLVDITARKQAEETKAKLAAIVESSDDAIVSKSLEGIITSWNRGAERIFGYTREEAIGQPVTMLIPVDRHSEEPLILERLKRGERVDHYETVRVRKDGTQLDISLTISPVRDAAGRIVGASKIARDITERKQTENALRESEERFHALADAVPVLIWVSDTTKACTWFNQCWKDFSGRPLDELLGDGWAKDVHPDDLDRCLNIYTRQFDAREPFSMEYRLKRHDGEYRWVLDNGIPRFGAKGVFAGYIGACMDLTERKQAVEALRASEQQLELVSNTVPALISYIDRDRRYRTCNYAYTDWFGVRCKDIAGKPVREVLGEDAWAAIEPRITQALAGETVEFETEVNYRTMGRRWIHAVYTPHRDAEGSVTGIVVMVNDITERKKVEKALAEAHSLLADKAKHLEALVQERTAKLTETVSELETFSYSVSHDLRSPLRAMQAYSNIIVESAGDKLSSQEREYLGRIERAALRLDRLTQDVLAYSRVSRSDIALQPVNLEKLIRDVIDQYPQILEHRAHIVVESPLLIVLAHESSLGQCVSNLLANGLKFVRSGETPKIQVWTEETMWDGQPVAKLVVEDNGIGIAPEHAHRIFQMFGRVHPDKQYDGTGIGLTIVKKAVERMGGTVGYDSKVGKGSRFWMLLKRA
jgi:PAS domain S-box-containing protein